MRGAVALMALALLAGCASETRFEPLAPPVADPPAPPPDPMEMSQCISSEASLALPEQEPTPPGVTPPSSGQVGPLQWYTFWALTCTIANETGPATLLVAFMDVEVDPRYDGAGDELFVVGVELDSPAIASWFAAVGLEFPLRTLAHGHQPVGGATKFHLETEDLAIDGGTVDGAPQAQVARRLLFGDGNGLVGAVDLTTSEHGTGAGTAALTFLEGVPPVVLAGDATAGRVGQARLAWASLGPVPAPNP